MYNFKYKNPTKIIFGKGQIKTLSTEIPLNSKILLLYGGGSIKKNGIYDQVKLALTDFQVVEFGGIPPNPEYSILMKAIEVIKDEGVDFLLAVGGGSVIDGTKFISAAALFEGDNPWEILSYGKVVKKGMPFATVLTIPATGSEMNSGMVITRKDTNEKLSGGGPGLYPVFSILDPEVVRSLPQQQIANGITDAFSHVLEQYITFPVDAKLQDRFSESILQTLIEVAPKVMNDPSDYSAAANFMWSCTMALNGLINKGVPEDWATHMIGHELTAMYGIDHARTLAIITPSLLKYNIESKKEKLVQYAERVWNIKEDNEEIKALKAIEKTEEFFHSLGIKTKLSEYTKDYNRTAQEIAQRFEQRSWERLGENESIAPSDVAKIVEMSY